MSAYSEIWEEIEVDWSFRESEIRFLEGECESISAESDMDRFRRSLIMMLYAHLEGSIKFMLLAYIRSLNVRGERLDKCSGGVAAAAMDIVFSRMENPNTKCDTFRRTLPDDFKLHRAARRKEFLGSLDRMLSSPLRVPDEIVDLESNLKPAVLKKSLFLLDLPYDFVDEYSGCINKLIGIRNNIAHGQVKSGVDKATYDQLKRSVMNIRRIVRRVVLDAVRSEVFRKSETCIS